MNAALWLEFGLRAEMVASALPTGSIFMVFSLLINDLRVNLP
jgi:hypothetical protein